MKKLTNRVLAGGLWFDVPLGAQYVSIDEVGYAQSHELEPAISGDTWAAGGYDCALGFVELEGEDWRSCRWYVGDQVGGEDVERRALVIRGIEKALHEVRLADDPYVNDRIVDLLNGVRNGKVDL